jgi:hypothetical protein
MGTLSTVVAESHLSPTERAWSDESGEGKEMYYCSCIKERMKGRDGGTDARHPATYTTRKCEAATIKKSGIRSCVAGQGPRTEGYHQ